MRVWTRLLLFVLVISAVPAQATVFRIPCNNELGARDAAFAALKSAFNAAKAAEEKLKAATFARDQTGSNWYKSMELLDAARGEYRSAMGDLLQCQLDRPKEGCNAKYDAVDAAKARLQVAKSAEISAFGAFKTACDNLKAAEADMNKASDLENAAREKYERASEALQKCLENHRKPRTDPPVSTPGPRRS